MTTTDPSPSSLPVCRRCGMCCLRGGPTLMVEDVSRITGGVLTLEALVCLRSGEWARDDARGTLRPLERERIKVAGLGDQAHPWRCRFFTDGSGCAIYVGRPAQCAALLCMDTGPLEKLLEREAPLDRAGALRALAEEPGVPGFPALTADTLALLPDLLAAHEEQNPVRSSLLLAWRLGFTPTRTAGLPVENVGDRPEAPGEPPFPAEEGPVSEEFRQEALAHLGEAARRDAAFRQLCVERGGVPAAILPFLLGRPLADLLAEVGLRPTAD